MTPPTRATGRRTERKPILRRAAGWAWTRLERRSALRPTAGGGLALLAVSVAVSLASVGALETTVRIRWSVGTHYGPEYASTALVLAAFPLLLAAVLVASRALEPLLERVEDDDAIRGCYELAVLATLSWLLLAQVALVIANLW